MFSLVVTFYVTKIENRTKKSLTQLLHFALLPHIGLYRDSIFGKNADFFQNMLVSAKLRGPWY